MQHSPFEGRLIRLRAREAEDEPSFFRWINDPEVTEHLSARYPYSHVQEKAYLASASDVSYKSPAFAVETLAEGKLIGGVELRPSNPEDRCADLGISLGEKEFWNGGYGTDTMFTVCRAGFQVMNLNRIELTVFAPNERARHVYEKVGFQLEGCHRDAHFKFGRYIDVYQMGLLRDEFRDDPMLAREEA
jgi:RimJ/RimL family protein N-acetyltransferase